MHTRICLFFVGNRTCCSLAHAQHICGSLPLFGAYFWPTLSLPLLKKWWCVWIFFYLNA